MSLGMNHIRFWPIGVVALADMTGLLGLPIIKVLQVEVCFNFYVHTIFLRHISLDMVGPYVHQTQRVRNFNYLQLRWSAGDISYGAR